jgi:protein-disulfide isomerase
MPLQDLFSGAFFMRLSRPFAAVLAGAALCTLLVAPLAAQGLTDAQKQELGPLIREYLLKNPEVLQEAFTELQNKKEAEAVAMRQGVIGDKSSALYSTEFTGVVGPDDADVTIVEFFDYNCGYCKKALPDVQKIIESDAKVRFLLKDFPILSKESQEAAIIAMAVKKQLKGDKFFAFHVDLMGTKGRIGKEQALDAAKASGIDMARLEKDMTDPGIQATLQKTQELAQTLDITGTPSYIVGPDMVVGAVGFDDLSTRIANIRKCGKGECG